MNRSISYFLIFLGLILFPNIVFAEEYGNFDSKVNDFFWDYKPFDESLIFSVQIKNISDYGNFIVHTEIGPEKNQSLLNEKHVLELNTGDIGTAKFKYNIESISDLFVATWINPPKTSNDPDFVFDFDKYRISEEEIWQKIVTAIDGVPLSFTVVPNEISNLDIKITSFSLDSDKKGIRVIYSGNSEVCNNFIFKIGSEEIGQFSGQRFFDRITDLGEVENYDEFHIVCELRDNDRQSQKDIISIQKDMEGDVIIEQVNTFHCSGFLCFFPSSQEESNSPLMSVLGIIAGIITLVTIIVKKKLQIKTKLKDTKH